MAILFCGVVMSHYTHLNLSPVTQITVQQTFRTISFIAGKFCHLIIKSSSAFVLQISYYYGFMVSGHVSQL